MQKIKIYLKGIIMLIIAVFSASEIHAQNTSKYKYKRKVTDNNSFYEAVYVSAGLNAWQITDSRINMNFLINSNELINSSHQLSACSIAPHIAFGLETGNIRKYFFGMNAQFIFGAMTGIYFDFMGGINFPIFDDKILLQIGSGIFVQEAFKVLDSRSLKEAIKLKNTSFKSLKTSLSEENYGFRPFVSLKYPLGKGKLANFQLTMGYQFDIYYKSRIDFNSTTPFINRSRRSPFASFYLDDNLFDFQLNEQKINRTPFNYNGFFINTGITFVFYSIFYPNPHFKISM